MSVHTSVDSGETGWAYVQLEMSPKVVAVCLARRYRRVRRRFVRGSREISLVPSLLRVSTDALIRAIRLTRLARFRSPIKGTKVKPSALALCGSVFDVRLPLF